MNKAFSLRHDDRIDPVGESRFDAVAEARRISIEARQRAQRLDEDTSFPTDDIEALRESGLLGAPLPITFGGYGLGGHGRSGDVDSRVELARVLVLLGSGSLPLGRLYEGHVNALTLVAAYGTSAQCEWIAHLVHRGELLGVWNTQAKDGVHLVGRGAKRHLDGRKIYCSGAGHIRFPLITASDETGNFLMVIPEVGDRDRVDLSDWMAHGMRASASGAVDFTGISIADHQILGRDDDFHAQPLFSTGAWRFAAVQTGGIAAVFDAARTHLVATGRQDAPQQRARMGTAALAVQTARHWINEAALISDNDTIDPQARIAHVNLARIAVERAGLDVLELAQRSVGLAGFQRSHPLERMTRDLATYLRQPNPDGALDQAAACVLNSQTPMVDLWPWH